MKVAVVGLWHLGTVTAACLADAGHDVVAIDGPDAVATIDAGQLPVDEPGLADLTAKAVAAGKLRFSDRPDDVHHAEVVWVTYDTPVDDDDQADVEFVLARVEGLFDHLSPGTVVLVSSQIPVGSTGRLEAAFAEARPGVDVRFACSPENLRLGKAIQVFTNPDRFVVGVRRAEDRATIEGLLAPITDRIEWMGVESAEMTKHAINAFLATSVAFINDLASLCELVGADAEQVSRGLKTDIRIGPKAYLKAGAAFAGGTLARDVAYLEEHFRRFGLPGRLFASVQHSNEAHKQWPLRRAEQLLGDLADKTVAVLGLTYKVDTNTLRRSASVEACRALHQRGAKVVAFDPAIPTLPAKLTDVIALAQSPGAALTGAAVALIMTEWPVFLEIPPDTFADGMARPLVLDVNGFLRDTLAKDDRIEYLTVGIAHHAD